MKRLVLAFLLLAGCSDDPTAHSDAEDLSKSFTYHCNVSHHSVDALKLRVSKTKAKVSILDSSEFSGVTDGSTFTNDPNYVPHSAHFAGRAKYDWDTDNTVLIMEQALRTGGSVGYLTIEGGHIARERADFVCRR